MKHQRVKTILLGSLSFLDLNHSQANTTPRNWKTALWLEPRIQPVTQPRCWGHPGIPGSDNLSYDEAHRRAQWALSCGHIAKSSEILFYQYMNSDTWVWERYPEGKMSYPTFAYNRPTENFPVWIPDLSHCDMPDDVIFLTLCTTGCYTPTQLVNFEDGPASIPDTMEKNRSQKIMTLSSESSIDSLDFIAREVSYFTADPFPKKQRIITFKTMSDRSIEVTEEHPLVKGNGFIALAQSLEVGDELVTSAGQKDPIVSIESYDYWGKVYNVAPNTHGSEGNIIVAQDFLNGSARYQDGTVKDFQRVISRQLINIKEIR